MPDLYTLLIGIAALVLAGSYFETDVGNVLLQPISVPVQMEQNGYTSDVFGQMILDEMQRIRFEAGPYYVSADVSEATNGMNISIAGANVSLTRVRILFAQAQGAIKYQFSGSVVAHGDKLVLMLTSLDAAGHRGFHTDTASLDDPYALVSNAARDILTTVDPYTLAKLQFEEDKRIGDFSKSLAMIQDLFARMPENQYYLLNNLAGRALELSGRTQQAIEAYRRAINIQPNYAMTYSNLALVMRQIGLQEEADKLDQTAISKAPNFFSFFRFWGEVYRRAGDNERCVYNFTRFVHYAPNDAHAYYDLSSCLRPLGRMAEANTALGRAVALNPSLGAVGVPSAV
jgi:tetratricopeptide (TPR) repeat protein